MYTNLKILVQFVSSDRKDAMDTNKICSVAENLSARVPARPECEMYETQIDVSLKTAVLVSGHGRTEIRVQYTLLVSGHGWTEIRIHRGIPFSLATMQVILCVQKTKPTTF